MNYHVKVCHEVDSFFTCSVCDDNFKTIAELYKHKKSAHSKDVTIKCRYCEKHLSNRSNLLRHKQEKHCKATRFDTSRIEVSHYAFACDQCDFVTKRKFHLIRHVKMKHSTDDQTKEISGEEKKTSINFTNTCPHCYKTFCNKSNLKRHIVSVHEIESSSDGVKDEINGTSASVCNQNREIIKKQCNYCNQTFLSTNLWRHIEEVHCKTKYNTDQIEVSAFPYRCEQCDFKTKRKFDLKRHCMQKHSLCDVTFPCVKCAKIFKYESCLKRHNKTCLESIPKA